MRYSTVSGLVMAALVSEVVAGPAHAHLHQRAHQKKDVDWDSLDWDDMGIDWTSAYYAGQKTKTTATATSTVAVAKVAAATTTAAAAAAATTSSSSSASDSSDSSSSSENTGLFDGLVGAANYITKFGTAVSGSSGSLGDDYRGNYGSPYGHNVMKVSSTSGYDFTTTFKNTASHKMTINCWNKVGPDNQTYSGSCFAPTNTTLTMALKPGQSQIVAFQDNSQIACSESSSNHTASGAFAMGWFEAQFRSDGSGYDYSAIESAGGNDYLMNITSTEASCVSSNTQNYWLTATDPIGDSDGSCYISQSTAHLTAEFGGKKS